MLVVEDEAKLTDLFLRGSADEGHAVDVAYDS
jgi:DNA-binding response OmpR family regulator